MRIIEVTSPETCPHRHQIITKSDFYVCVFDGIYPDAIYPECNCKDFPKHCKLKVV